MTDFDLAVVGDDLDGRVFGEEDADNYCFQDEECNDSEDDCPDREFTPRQAFHDVIGRDPRVHMFRDLARVRGAILEGGEMEGMLAELDDGLANSVGREFHLMLELKSFIEEYSVIHHRPHRITQSDSALRYTVRCKQEQAKCEWRLCARLQRSGNWKITSVVQPHTCFSSASAGKHKQLTCTPDSRQLYREVSLLSTPQLLVHLLTVGGWRHTCSTCLPER